MDRKRNTRASTSRSQKVHHLENTFAVFAECKKAAKRRILFCDKSIESNIDIDIKQYTYIIAY